ncbi:hypothetical protein F5Y10DRAFT_266913 [Nemania abortiva]|nr:hypothetical protein F5Y10DRAFT_266913 [Nemania abortiva]
MAFNRHDPDSMGTARILTAAVSASIVPLVAFASGPVNPMFEIKAERPLGVVKSGALINGHGSK